MEWSGRAMGYFQFSTICKVLVLLSSIYADTIMVDTIRTKEYADFVGKLREARLEAGLRQIDVAKKLKRTQSYVSHY